MVLIAAAAALLIGAVLVVGSHTGVSTGDPLKTVSSGPVTVRYQRPWRDAARPAPSTDALVADMLTGPRLVLTSPTAILPPARSRLSGDPGRRASAAGSAIRTAGVLDNGADCGARCQAISVDAFRGRAAGRLRGAEHHIRHCVHLRRERPSRRLALLLLRPRARRRRIGRLGIAARSRRTAVDCNRPGSRTRRSGPQRTQASGIWIAARPRRGRGSAARIERAALIRLARLGPPARNAPALVMLRSALRIESAALQALATAAAGNQRGPYTTARLDLLAAGTRLTAAAGLLIRQGFAPPPLPALDLPGLPVPPSRTVRHTTPPATAPTVTSGAAGQTTSTTVYSPPATRTTTTGAGSSPPTVVVVPTGTSHHSTHPSNVVTVPTG